MIGIAHFPPIISKTSFNEQDFSEMIVFISDILI
jgi:hypothetical protein